LPSIAGSLPPKRTLVILIIVILHWSIQRSV
jgi:hypothetical protein